MTAPSRRSTKRATEPTTARNAGRVGRESRPRPKVGQLKPTTANVRTALANAALMLLATDGPGAVQVRHVLSAALPHAPGVVMTVSHKSRFGQKRPKIVGTSTQIEPDTYR